MSTKDAKAIAAGTLMAKKFFSLRSTKSYRNVEVHLSETELATLLALAWERGHDDANNTCSDGHKGCHGNDPVATSGSICHCANIRGAHDRRTSCKET